MKHIILLALTLAAPSLLWAQSPTSLNAFNKISLAEKPFTVTGSFEGYDPAIDSFRFCKVVYNHLYRNNQQNHVGEIDKTGRFNISFPLNRPQEVMLLFGEELVKFYAVPGTSLAIKLDLPAFKELHKLPDAAQLQRKASLEFTGQYAQLNKEHHAFQPVLLSLLNYKMHSLMIDSLDPMAYKAFRIGIMQRMLDTLAAFNQQNNTSSEFQQVMTQYIRYYAAEDLLRYSWLHGVVKTKRPPVQLTRDYLSFLADMPLNNEEALITESYSNFLREYANFYQMRPSSEPIPFNKEQFMAYLKQAGKPVTMEEEKLLTMPGQATPDQQQGIDSFLKKYSQERYEFQYTELT